MNENSFVRRGWLYSAIESKNGVCFGCAFYDNVKACRKPGEPGCSPGTRTDNRHVIWEKQDLLRSLVAEAVK